MSDKKYNVLFLCTGNSARSIMAESDPAQGGRRHFSAFSAGSRPKGEVHPLAIKVLESFDYPNRRHALEILGRIAGAGAPNLDFVFTVCDNAAGEVCPVWPGQPMTAHWGIEDPAAVDGTAIEKERAFVLAFRYLRNRITIFNALPIKRLDRLALSAKLREIGEAEGASLGAKANA